MYKIYLTFQNKELNTLLVSADLRENGQSGQLIMEAFSDASILRKLLAVSAEH